jgi:hypothetical protein
MGERIFKSCHVVAEDIIRATERPLERQQQLAIDFGGLGL